MRVGWDVDGVSYDFVESVRKYVCEHKNMDRALTALYRRWEFYEDWGMTLKQFLEACDEGVDAGVIFTYGGALPGVRESMQRILDAGHTIHVITDRSFGSPGASEAATARWLAANLPPVQSLTFSRDKAIIRTDMMIDDKPQNYDDLVAVGCDARLLSMPWNQANDERKRVDSVEEFADLVLSRELVSV